MALGAGSEKIPVEYNEYVGGNVYGNILDRYANPSYNLKLYMIKKMDNDTLYDDPKNTVVLAQTGVTGASIDDLVIDFQYDTSNTTAQKITFSVTQPGAADFLDQIQLAKAYLGLEMQAQTLLWLEIRFQGYTAFADDEDEGGEVDIIAGPYRYRLQLNSIEVEINETGSIYNMECLMDSPGAMTAYKDTSYTLPRSIDTVGKTLTEHVQDLEKKLNDWHSGEAAAGMDVPDEYKFDLSKLVATSTGSGGTNSQDTLSDDSMLTSESVEIEDLNRLQSEIWKAGSIIDRQQELENAPVYTGTGAEPVYDQDAIKHREGATYDRVFATLLSMCPQFYSKVSRKEDPLDPESPVKKDQAFVSWFRILAESEILGYDKKRGVMARRYIYTPVLYKTPREDIALTPEELDFSPEDAEARMKQLIANKSILKAYSYLFTGLNDQILGLDIRYKQSAAILQPPAGGTVGDISLVASNQLSAQVSEDTDPSLEGAVDFFNELKDVVDKGKVGSLFDDLKDLGNKLTDGVLGQLSDVIGLDSGTIKNAITDATGQQAQQLIDALDKKQIAALAGKQETEQPASKRPTEDPATLLSVDRENYKPEFSGFVYSKDILNPDDGETFAADLVDRLGYATAGGVTRVKQQVDSTKDIPNKAGAASYKSGSARNKLFGFLVEQQNANQFLQTVDLQLRGDPWYLSGPISTEQSTEEQVNYFKDTNVFWLEIRAPITYDPDWQDEDSDLNSGYWQYKGVSKTFTAAYTIATTKCSFSKGAFTVDLHGQRTGLDATLIEPKPSGGTE